MFYFEHLNSKRPEHPITAKMSASPIARQCISHSQVIPTKKVLIHDTNQLPDVYSSTPNGTLFSTTPGGKHPLFSFLTLFCVFFASSILCDTIFAHRHPAGDLRENLIFALIWAPAHTHTHAHMRFTCPTFSLFRCRSSGHLLFYVVVWRNSSSDERNVIPILVNSHDLDALNKFTN